MNISDLVKIRRAQRGSVMLEFALSLPVFLAILLSGIELLRVSFKIAQFDHAVYQAGRYASLGFVEPPNGSPSQDYAIESVKTQIQNASGVEVGQFSICPVDDCTQNSRGNEGSAAPQWISIRATAYINLFSDRFQLPYTSRTLVRNEPRFTLTSSSIQRP